MLKYTHYWVCDNSNEIAIFEKLELQYEQIRILLFEEYKI